MTDDLRLLPPDMASRSASDREIVLPFVDALAAVQHLRDSGHHIVGWEGWLRCPDGALGHSARHQGTVDLSHLTALQAAEFCRSTMVESEDGWRRAPEVPEAELLYCITVASDDDSMPAAGEDGRSTGSELLKNARSFTCPCCGHRTFDRPPGSYDICPVCFWEDDDVQLLDPAFRGGANSPSLMECQANYARFAACEERFGDRVRPPEPEEAPRVLQRRMHLVRDIAPARIREEFASLSEYALVLHLREDGFDPSTLDDNLQTESGQPDS